jgi:hypothetical protein
MNEISESRMYAIKHKAFRIFAGACAQSSLLVSILEI